MINISFLFVATMSPTLSADLSTLFDVGGIIGAIAAGVISDYSGMSATTCVGMLAAAAPMVSHSLLAFCALQKLFVFQMFVDVYLSAF